MDIGRLGVFLPRWVGDVVMATPVLRALRAHLGPNAHITGILKPYARDVLSGTHWIDDYLWHDYRSRDANERGWGFVRQLRRQRFDTVLLLINSPRTGWLAWLSGARQRIGYRRLGHQLLLTRVADYPREGVKIVPHSAVDAYIRLAELLDCPVADRRVELATTETERRAADTVWQTLGIDPQQPVVGLSTGGAYGAAKRWPDEHFGQLARELADRLDAQVLVVCGPAERTAAQRIVELAHRPGVVSLAGGPAPIGLSVGLTKACLERCRIVVATDSGPRHLAMGLGVPTVALFGPTDPRWSHTPGGELVELQHAVPCGPCGRRVCPLGHHACMRDLLPETVFEAAAELWRRSRGFHFAPQSYRIQGTSGAAGKRIPPGPPGLAS